MAHLGSLNRRATGTRPSSTFFVACKLEDTARSDSFYADVRVFNGITRRRPSWWAVNQPGDYIYLTDGYGSFNIYLFNRDGKFMNKTFGGPGQSHGHFTNPHAITYDVRSKLLAVSDRGNNRIEFYNFSNDNSKVGNETFDYVKSVAFPGAAYPELSGFLPCNFRVLENATDPADDGFVVVPALEGTAWPSSASFFHTW